MILAPQIPTNNTHLRGHHHLRSRALLLNVRAEATSPRRSRSLRGGGGSSSAAANNFLRPQVKALQAIVQPWNESQTQNSTTRPSSPSSKFSFFGDLAASPSTSTSLTSSPLVMIGLTSAVSFICSIDRAAMSVALVPMSATFDWDDQTKGAISAAFFGGYMLTNLCGGYLATRFSPKLVLAGGVFLWSLWTLATPAAAASSNLFELLAVRSMMGVGEGVSYPSIQNLVRTEVASHARSRALSFIYSGHQLGTIASYLIAPILISQLGWESCFYVFGSLGFFWLAGWSPLLLADTKARQEEEEERKTLMSSASTSTTVVTPLRIQDVPWKEFASSKAFWAIVAAQVTVGIGSCLSFSWLPTFYSEIYHVDVAQSASFCIVPVLATVVTTNIAGHVADSMINNRVLSKTDTRKVMQTVASLGPAACLLRLACTQSSSGGGGGIDGAGSSLTDAVVMVTAWLALGGFSAAGYGSNHQDISSKWAGVMFGLSNGIASLAGTASIFATGLVLHQTHDWSLIFSGAAVMYVVGAGVYLQWGSAEQEFE